MTTSTPNNALLQSITPATKARALESIYPNGQICYADQKSKRRKVTMPWRDENPG